MKPPKPNPKKEQQSVDLWNEHFPVGQPVAVRLDDGTALSTVTTSKAQLLGGHSAVIWLKGISGCYSLHRVMAQANGKAVAK